MTTHHTASGKILISLAVNCRLKEEQKVRLKETHKIVCLSEDALLRRSYINPQEK